jgi:hypothetical protein
MEKQPQFDLIDDLLAVLAKHSMSVPDKKDLRSFTIEHKGSGLFTAKYEVFLSSRDWVEDEYGCRVYVGDAK